MSDQEVEKIAKLEANYDNLMDKVDEILKRFDNLETKLDCALDKKADKESQWAERFLMWGGGIIGVGLIGYFGTLIIKLIELK